MEVGRDFPHQAQGLNTDLEGIVWEQGGGEAAVGVEEGVGKVEFPLFPCQVGVNACTNRLDDDVWAVEVVLLKDVDICLDINEIGRALPGWVLCNGINEVAYMDDA